jgi:predicted small secreted protein
LRSWRYGHTIRQSAASGPHLFEENSMKRLFAVLLLATFSIGTLSACNTMEGLGKDVKKLGEKVEDKANR